MPFPRGLIDAGLTDHQKVQEKERLTISKESAQVTPLGVQVELMVLSICHLPYTQFKSVRPWQINMTHLGLIFHSLWTTTSKSHVTWLEMNFWTLLWSPDLCIIL